MDIKNLPAGSDYPEKFNVVIEIPKGSRNKYEYDEELDVIKLDRVYTAAMSLPYDYGFIPQTRSEDGDHLDAILILDTQIYPGIVVEARPIGLLKMVDSGEADEKIIAVPTKDIRLKHIQSLDDLSAHFKQEVQHYFENYKNLENKVVQVTGWGDKDEAIEVLNKSLEK